MLSPRQIVEDRMFANDAFSQCLGIKLVQIGEGNCTITMQIDESMTNGFAIGHGGITYSFADSALAFASNSHGYHAVSIETSMSHVRPAKLSDVLMAKAVEINRSKSLGVYQVEVFNQDEKLVGVMKGTVFIKDALWE